MIKATGKVKNADVFMIGSDNVELWSKLERKTAGRVLEYGVLFEPTPIQAIAARYIRFTEHTVDDERLEELLDGIEVRGPATEDTPYCI